MYLLPFTVFAKLNMFTVNNIVYCLVLMVKSVQSVFKQLLNDTFYKERNNNGFVNILHLMSNL